MTQTQPAGQQYRCRCEHCGASYRVGVESIGRNAKCNKCRQVFRLLVDPGYVQEQVAAPESDGYGLAPEAAVPMPPTPTAPNALRPPPLPAKRQPLYPPEPGTVMVQPGEKMPGYAQLPWHNKSIVLSRLEIIGLFFGPCMLVACIAALSGPVYYRTLGKEGEVRVWPTGNKVAAIILLVLWCIFAFRAFSG